METNIELAIRVANQMSGVKPGAERDPTQFAIFCIVLQAITKYCKQVELSPELLRVCRSLVIDITNIDENFRTSVENEALIKLQNLLSKLEAK